MYGLNWGGKVIPDGIKKKFPVRYKFGPGEYGYLAGVAHDVRERDMMLAIANNGHRRLFAYEKKTAAGTWFGIYVY